MKAESHKKIEHKSLREITGCRSSPPVVVPHNQFPKMTVGNLTLQRYYSQSRLSGGGGEATQNKNQGFHQGRERNNTVSGLNQSPPSREKKLNLTRRELSTATSFGHSLDHQTKAYFEPRFGRDFSNIRIHTNSEAHRSAQAIKADAYTYGRNIVFKYNQYDPQSQTGRRLLAHELTHAVQQAGASENNQNTGREADKYEKEAENAADRIMGGGRISVLSSLNGKGVQRWPPEEEPVCRAPEEGREEHREPSCEMSSFWMEGTEAQGDLSLPFNPEAVDVLALTHGELNSYTRQTNIWLEARNESHPSHNDFSALRDRLAEERDRRVDGGNLWLSEVIEGGPGLLMRLVAGEGGRTDVITVDVETANNELPCSSSTRTMTEDQFQTFLNQNDTPTIDFDTYVQIQLMNSLMSGQAFDETGEGAEVPKVPFVGHEDLLDVSLTGAQASVAGVGAVGLYNAPLDISLMETYARPMSGPGSGGPSRAFGRFAEAGVPGQLRYGYGLGLVDLNTLPWTGPGGILHPATQENYPTFDFQRTRGPMARVLGIARISVKTSQRVNQIDRFRYYLQGIDAMMEAGGGRSTLPSYIANQPELAGTQYGQARSIVLSGAVVAVNSDDATGFRALLADPTHAAISPNLPAGSTLWTDTGHQGGPQSTISIRNLFSAEMRENPVRIETSSGIQIYDSPDVLDQARANNTITQAQYETAQHEVGRGVSRRVVSSGVSTADVGAMRTSRTGIPLPQAQLEPLITPEYIASERYGGGTLGQVRAAGRSSVQGGGAGVVLAVFTTAGMMLIDEAEHPDWEQEIATTGGLGMLGGSVGSATEQVLISSGTRYAINRTASGAPSWLSGARVTALGRFGGGGVGAGVTELVSMGFLEQREHTGTEVTVRTGRAFVLGGTSTYVGVAAGTAAGTILTSALAGTAVGTAVPGLGNAIGFLIGLGVGIGIYLLADRIVPGGREDWENPRRQPERRNFHPSFNLYGCFAAGTKVLMADGTEKPIETIQIGEEVAAFNELTQRVTCGVVRKTYRYPPSPIVRLTLANGRALRVTREHRFFVNGRWVRVASLKPGQACLCAASRESNILAPVSIISFEFETLPLEVFNLSVTAYHTYFAESAVVHNAK